LLLLLLLREMKVKLLLPFDISYYKLVQTKTKVKKNIEKSETR